MKKIFLLISIFVSLTTQAQLGDCTSPPAPNVNWANCDKSYMNLTNANLTGANLSGADLRGADLSQANLSSANLTGANLRGANLTNADLSGADLSRTDLTGADLSNAYFFNVNLSGAIFYDAYLFGTIFYDTNLSGMDLSGTDMSYASFFNVNLSGAIFYDAYLFGTMFYDTNLSGMDLSGTDMSYANLSGADLSRTDFSGTDLTGADLSGTDLTFADLSYANLSGAIFIDANLVITDLNNANLTNANLSFAYLFNIDLTTAYLNGTDFTLAYLESSNLENMDLSSAIFTGCDLSYSNLTNAYLEYAFMVGANLSYVNLSNADLRNANLSYAFLSYSDLTNAILCGANLIGTNLDGANLTNTSILVGGTIDGSTTVCPIINSTVLTLSGQIGNIIRWESSLDNFDSVVTNVANTTQTLTATNLTRTTYFRAVLTGGSCGTTYSDIATIIVPTASISGNSSFCIGGNTVLRSNVTSEIGTISYYQWQVGGVNVESVGTGDTFVATSAGSYTVTVTNSIGCSYTSSAFVVSVIQPIQNNAGTNGTLQICANSCTVTESELFAALGGTPQAGGVWSPLPSGVGVYTYTVTSGAPCNYTSTATVTVTSPTNVNPELIVKVYIEGFFRANGTMAATLYNLGESTDASATDTIEVNLWSATSLSNPIPDFAQKVILHTDGTSSVQLPRETLGNSYYVAIKHRNSIEVWSSEPIMIDSTVVYDFSTSQNAAYTDGFNNPMKLLSDGKYAMFGGDINLDGTVDLFDAQISENRSSNLQSSYDASDCNGDGSSDLSDLQLIDNNTNLLIFYARPY